MPNKLYFCLGMLRVMRSQAHDNLNVFLCVSITDLTAGYVVANNGVEYLYCWHLLIRMMIWGSPTGFKNSSTA